MKIKEKRITRFGFAMAVFMIILFCQLLYVDVMAAKSSDTPVDFVLVLDQSGSMNSSDHERLTVSAAKMFVDMLPAENARLAVIAFGDDYGSEAYPVNLGYGEDYDYAGDSNYSKNRVYLAYELNRITSQDDKNNAKSVIDEVMEQSDDAGRYTPIGFALTAANQVLAEGGSEAGSAAIILMSDGRVSGQGISDKYNEGYDYRSIDNAADQAASMDWPIYCLELNYDGINDNPDTPVKDPANSEGNIGYHQMREVIPGRTYTEPVILNKVTQAQNAFAGIFAEFFDAEPTTASGVIENGQVSLTFPIGEMIAETNLTLTGNITEVERVVLTNPSGKQEEYQKSVIQGDRIVSYDNSGKYITIKLIMPSAGDWSVTAYGTDGVEIGLYAVSIREMNLQLQADITDEVLGKGATVNFTASYIYNGEPYSGTTVYQNTKAYLVISETGERIPMVGGEYNYAASYTFSNSGTYTVTAYVESDLFRNEVKKSGSYTYSVGNLATEPTGTVGELEVNVGKSIDPIDMSAFFTNKDNDILAYSANIEPASDITWDITDSGVLAIQAGKKAGSYTVTVGAKDSMMEAEAVQSFALKVINQPLVLGNGLKDRDEITVDFSYNADSLPENLLKILGVTTAHDAEIRWMDYFIDPDGIPAQISVATTEESNQIEDEWDDERLYVSGHGKGRSVYTVTAVDASDSSVQYTLTVSVNSLDAISLIWKKIRIPAMIITVIILFIFVLCVLAFFGRCIYGVWDISSSVRPKKNSCVLGKTAAGRRSKCDLGKLLMNLDIPNDFSGVKLMAGNRFGGKVYLTGLKSLDSLVYGTSKFDKTRLMKKKKLPIRPHQSVTLTKGNVTVKMERKK